MSNATEPSRQSGERRRRRSRGGRNRNNNRNRDNNNSQNQGNSNSNRSGQGRSRGGRRRSGRRPQPVKLTWWQKLLKAIGLYKAPDHKRGGKPQSEKTERQAPKSNTRVARTNESENSDRKPKDAEPKKSRNSKRSRGGDPSTVDSNRVYVGNLSYDVTEQDLQELFKGVGTVRRSEIVYNRNTHRSKGYGFVDMIHMDDAIRAVEVLHDQPFMGRNMIVSGASSKQAEQQEEEETGPEIKAADIELAPLPAATEATPATEDAPAAESTPEPAAETPAEPAADASEPAAEAEAAVEAPAEPTEEAPATSEEEKATNAS